MPHKYKNQKNAYHKAYYQDHKGVMVAWYRRKLGISGVQAINTQNWASMAGTMSDTEVASLGGISRAAVTNYRRRHNIPRYRKEEVA